MERIGLVWHGCGTAPRAVALLVLAVASCFAWPGTALAATKTWVGGGGSWHDAPNWSPAGVPTAADRAVISSGNPAVTDADATVGSISIGSAMTVTGRTLTVTGATSSSIAAGVTLTNGDLELAGATTWSAGRITIIGAGLVTPSGTLTVSAPDAIMDAFDGASNGRRALVVPAGGTVSVTGVLSAGLEIENDGTLRAPAGGSLLQYASSAAPADSSGSFVATGSGALAFAGVAMGAASSASGTGTIRFAGGTSTVAAGAAYAAGITEVGASGLLDFDDAGSTGALRMSGSGIRGGTGTLTVGGGASQLGFGTFRDAGVTVFSASSQTAIDGNLLFDSPAGGHTLRLNGATTWSAGRVTILDAGVVENAGTLTVTATDALIDTFDNGGVDGRVALHNLTGGTIAVDGTIQIGVEIENDGTLHARAGGTLQQYQAITSPADSAGAFVADGSGVLAFASVAMGTASSASGTGTIRFESGTSTVAAGAGYAAGITDVGSGGLLDFDDTGSTSALRMTGGTRGGTGTLTVGSGDSRLGFGTFQDTGSTRFSTGSTTRIDGNLTLQSPAGGHTLVLDGDTTWTDAGITILDAGVVENAGTLTIGGATAVDDFDGGGVDGEIAFRSAGGAIELPEDATLSAWVPLELTGGVLEGAGTVNNEVRNTGGTVRSDGLSISGSYTQGAGGTLHADVGAAGAGLLEVGGTATLAGTLEVATEAGFVPASSASFRILDAFERTGTFATTTGLQITPTKRYRVFYDGTGASLTVGDGPASITPPSIPGSALPGATVTCDPGAWAGSPAFAYAWLRDGAAHASGQAYTVAGDDVGHALVCRVTATNANGSTDADSNTLTPSAPPTPTPTSTPIATPSATPAVTPTPVPPPTAGETVNVAAERGKVTVRLPDGTTVPVGAGVQIVTGSVVDTRAGAVRLVSEGKGGKLASGVFSEGLFKVTQTTGKRPVTVLSLVEKLDCKKAGKARVAGRRKKRKRRLWGDANGDYRTRGRSGSAVNTGTRWLTEDRCDGTLFRVKRGTIKVTRNGSRKAVRVRAGRQYLVRARP